jgi:hypothetical protein
MDMRYTHAAFSDESNWNKGRYRSVSLVTLRREHMEPLSNRVSELLTSCGVSEFKWEKLKQARDRFAAEKLCKLAVEAACSGWIRIDTLLWDIEDKRHSVRGRDDVANLQRMYHHLMKVVLRDRWPDDSTWKLFPDEQDAVDWEQVGEILGHTGTTLTVNHDLFTGGEFNLVLKTDFAIHEVQPSSSRQVPLVQLADLFAGLSAFSRTEYDTYERFIASPKHQETLPLFASLTEASFTNSQTERCRVLVEFNRLCKERKLGVSLKTKRGLYTHTSKPPITFWWWTPQHDLDRAPVKQKAEKATPA